jgi:nucleotide-binding universal stress UspA family protein
MEKIIVAMNVGQFHKNVLDFACYVADLTRSNLTGIFLENLQEEELPTRRSLFGNPYIETIVADDIAENKGRRKLCDEYIRLFENACKNKGLQYTIHRAEGIPEDEIVTESRFADLLIVDGEMTFEDIRESTPTKFVRDMMRKVECPAVIAPFSFYGVEEIVLAYDGSASSVYAIKQFAYLFPDLTDNKLTILQVNQKEDSAIIDKEKLSELLQLHFTAINFQILQGKAADEIFGYLLEKKETFVVMGAYSHKILSGLFRHSTAELILKAVNLPVFIAHH